MNISITDFMFTFIESILLYWLINSIMSSRFSGKKKLLAIALAILINTVSILYLLNYSVTIKFLLFFIISLVLTHIVYIGKIYIKAFFILVAYYIFLISDVIVGNLSSYIANMNIQKMLNLSTASLEFSVLAKILNTILIIIFIFYFGKNRFEIPPKYWITMDVIVLLFAIILQFIMEISPVLLKESSEYSIYIFGISIGFLIISGLGNL
ncbi:hypothetical protein A7X67_11885 [Clostridium sp. W14A]|nr:hypothetical protein A7X67_11885 [Clostridium sp. W14A]